MSHLVGLLLAFPQLPHVVPESACFKDTVLENKSLFKTLERIVPRLFPHTGVSIKALSELGEQPSAPRQPLERQVLRQGRAEAHA